VTGFGVRVGVQTGPVVVGAIGAGSRVEYSALGDAVNTAARLQSLGEPGSVLVGEETFRLVEPMFEWGPATELDLKGKSAPVVARVALAATGTPVRTRGLEGVEAQLIGRERELAGRVLVDGVLAGTGAILLVTGEPGIGKTRLLAERTSCSIRAPPARAGTMARGAMRVLRRVDAVLALPGPPACLDRGARGRTGAAGPRRAPPDGGAALRRSFGRDLAVPCGAAGVDARARRRETSGRALPEALQYRTFEVMREPITRLTQDGPVAVVLEDLHWADATSLQLLERLFADTESAALLLVLTSRLERDHPWWRVKEEVARELPHRITDTTLEALSGDAGRELLHALVGDDTLPPDIERRILEPAEGNPFFLEELIRSLVDAGAVVHDEQGWHFVHDAPLEVPPTVEKVILARIDRLDAGTREALVAASVLGRQFGVSLLEAVVGAQEGAGGSRCST
jgi:class 3 adenylate cyclase